MTKQEAIELESQMDKLFSEEFGIDCQVSMSLTGALRISFENGFINIKTDTQVVDWVKWNGFYDDLRDYINKVIIVIRENKEKINMLMESYRM